MHDPTHPDQGHGRAEHCNPTYTWHGHVTLVRHSPPPLLLAAKLGEEGGCNKFVVEASPILLIKFIVTNMTTSFVSIII